MDYRTIGGETSQADFLQLTAGSCFIPYLVIRRVCYCACLFDAKNVPIICEHHSFIFKSPMFKSRRNILFGSLGLLKGRVLLAISHFQFNYCIFYFFPHNWTVTASTWGIVIKVRGISDYKKWTEDFLLWQFDRKSYDPEITPNWKTKYQCLRWFRYMESPAQWKLYFLVCLFSKQNDRVHDPP